MPFTWFGPPLFRYRDDDTGQFVSRDQIREWSNISIQSTILDVVNMVGDLANQQLTVGQWQQQMRQYIKDEVLRQYRLGKGAGEFTAQDYGSIGGMLAEQYGYLNRFAEEIAGGNLSEAQIRFRARMYIKSTKEAFERAQARTRGITDLPAYPGDGSSCLGLTQCGCEWEHSFSPVRNRWESFWRLGATEHCNLCLNHAQEWAPWVSEL